MPCLTRSIASVLLVAAVTGATARAQDPKSELQYRVQARFHSLPSYQVRSVSGPEHRPLFTVEVSAEGGVCGVGTGASKQAAEQEAAREALDSWNEVE